MAQRSDNRRGFFGSHGTAVAAGAAVVTVLAVVVVLFLRDKDQAPIRQVQEITMVTIQPPPPPPPPPQPIQQPKMIEQPKIVEPEVKQEKPQERPKEAPPKPLDAPPSTAPLGLDAKPTGPGDAFNLVGNPSGNGLLGGGGGGSRWGWYASLVQTQIEEALRANKKTRDAAMRIEIRLWPDAAGRIERVQLVSSTGNAAVDAAITEEVLIGLKLREPPPKDMPVPIVTRVTERRPG
jgi:periplasmic protein TonB